MYQVHTKSIKVCRISNMIQNKEKKKNEKTIYCYITKFMTLKNRGLTVLLKVYKLPV